MKVHLQGAKMAVNTMTETILGAAVTGHEALASGLLASACGERLAQARGLRGQGFERAMPLPMTYKGCQRACGYHLDFWGEKWVVNKLKAEEGIVPIPEAPVVTHRKLGGWAVGLLVNFSVEARKGGMKPFVCHYEDVSASSAPWH